MEPAENENVAKESEEISLNEHEEASARLKKRSRRVSFADITSVHVFDRDEDYETPPDSKPVNRVDKRRTPSGGSPRPHPQVLQDEDTGHRVSLSPTPSLGGENFEENESEQSVPEADTPGSMSDGETPSEGEFFGPVSLWHIAPGMTVRSPVVDDVTLDCTTFSLQFGKLMPPDKQCGNPTEDMKTPSGDIGEVSVATEDFKTPAGETAGVSPGNFMVLTKVKKLARRQFVSDDEPLDDDAGTNDMSLVEENQCQFDYASMPPDLDSLLAEKYSQINSDISSSQQNHRQEPFGSSSFPPKSAVASLKMGHDTESKDLGVKVERVTADAMENNGTRFTLDTEMTPFTIENVGTKHNKGIDLTAGDLSPSKFQGQQQKQQQSLLSSCWDIELKDHVDEVAERPVMQMLATMNNSTVELTHDVEMTQPTIDIVATKPCEDTKLTLADGSSPLNFLPGQPHQQQQRRSLKLGLNIEPKDPADAELEMPTTEIMATKHSVSAELTTSVDIVATIHGDCADHFNFVGEQQQQHRSLSNSGLDMEPNNPVDVEVGGPTVPVLEMNLNNGTKLTPAVEMSVSSIEIVPDNHCEDIEMIPADDASLLYFGREQQQQQQQQQGKLLKPGLEMEPKDLVNMELESSNIENMATKQKTFTELKPDVATDELPIQIVATAPGDDSYLYNSRGEQQQQRRLLNPGSDMEPNSTVDVAVERPTIDFVAMEQNSDTKLTADIEMNQCTIETATTNNNQNNNLTTADDSDLFDFKGKLQQQEKQQLRVLNTEQDVEPKTPVSMKAESCTVKILAAKDDNGTKSALDLKLNLSTIEIKVPESNRDTKLTPADDLSLVNFQGVQQHQQKQQQMRLPNPGWVTEPRDHLIEEVERATTKTMAAKNSIDTKLRPDVEMNQSTIEIVATVHDKGPSLTSADDFSILNNEEKQYHHHHQQQNLLNLELDIEPKDPVNVQVEKSTVEILATKHNDETNLTSDVEMNQSTRETLAAEDSRDTEFTRADGTPFLNLEGKRQQQQQEGERFSIFNRGPGGITESTSRRKQHEEFFCSFEDVNLNSRCTSLESQHSGKSIKLISKTQKVSEMDSTASMKDLLPVFSLSTTDIQQVCSYPKLRELDVSLHGKQQQQEKFEHSILKPQLSDYLHGPDKLVSEGQGHTLSLPQPTLDPITNNVQGMTPLSNFGLFEASKCDNLAVNVNEVKGCNIANTVFTTPANLITDDNANFSCSVNENIRHSNFLHGSSEHEVLTSLQDNAKNTLMLTPLHEKHAVMQNEEQAARLGAQEMLIKTNHGNTALPLSQLKGSFSHEQLRDGQRSGQYQITDCSSKHTSWKSMMVQHDRIDSSLKTNEDTYISEKVPCKLSQGGEELHLPLITKPKVLHECLIFMFLSRPELCLLQDTLKQLQADMDNMKVSTNLQFQALDGKTCLEVENRLAVPRCKRSGNVKWLQQMLAYQKSKLLLLQTKKEQLMKKAQELRSGCLEVDKLKSLCSQKLDPSNMRTDSIIMEAKTRAEKEKHIESLKYEIRKQTEKFLNKRALMESKLKGLQEENQKACETVIIMKQELDALDKKIKEFCELFCAFYKLKGNLTKEEITQLVENHVKNSTSNSLILQNLQLWKLVEVKSKLGQHSFELSYSDVLYQRIEIEEDGPKSNVFASHRLNFETIEKVFPFMNACKAFEIILGLKKSYKIGEARNIYQSIREMSFLVGTLMDVLEEVQLSRMRLHNLSFTYFDCVNACKLHLQLTFIDCTVGLKTKVVLDMDNLRFGVYPSDVLPLQVEIECSGRQPKGLLVAEEIHEAVLPLNPGYPRIKKLCDCISRLIESKGHKP